MWSFRVTMSAPCSILSPRQSYHASISPPSSGGHRTSLVLFLQDKPALPSKCSILKWITTLGGQCTHPFTGSHRVIEGFKNWPEHTHSELQFTLATLCPSWTDRPGCPGFAPCHTLKGTREVFVEQKESIHPTAFKQSSLRGNLSDEGPAIFKDSKARSLHSLSLKLLPTFSDHFM